ncbi:aldehyde dehydrogenase family protein [Peribacillus frigoritolerans]|nr:aldehyde dehydrogenase family protein [Peribacillus frigoritolerans]
MENSFLYQKNKRVSVIKQPVGVVAAITPWNFPLSMAARKLGPALASGCTVVLRPSREAPLSSVELVKIIDEAGLPKGVVNLVIGGSSEIVRPIMESKVVKKSFLYRIY